MLVSPAWALQLVPRTAVMRSPLPRMQTPKSPKEELVEAIDRYEKAITGSMTMQIVLVSLASCAVGSFVGFATPVLNSVGTSSPSTKAVRSLPCLGLTPCVQGCG